MEVQTDARKVDDRSRDWTKSCRKLTEDSADAQNIEG